MKTGTALHKDFNTWKQRVPSCLCVQQHWTYKNLSWIFLDLKKGKALLRYSLKFCFGQQIVMCRSRDWNNEELWSPHVFSNGEATTSAVVTQVAAQLAQVGDKMNVSYQRKKKDRDDRKFKSVTSICTFALFIAFRVFIWSSGERETSEELKKISKVPQLGWTNINPQRLRSFSRLIITILSCCQECSCRHCMYKRAVCLKLRPNIADSLLSSVLISLSQSFADQSYMFNWQAAKRRTSAN